MLVRTTQITVPVASKQVVPTSWSHVNNAILYHNYIVPFACSPSMVHVSSGTLSKISEVNLPHPTRVSVPLFVDAQTVSKPITNNPRDCQPNVCGHAECPSCKDYRDLNHHQCYVQTYDQIKAQKARARQKRRNCTQQHQQQVC